MHQRTWAVLSGQEGDMNSVNDIDAWELKLSSRICGISWALVVVFWSQNVLTRHTQRFIETQRESPSTTLSPPTHRQGLLVSRCAVHAKSLLQR